MFQKNLLPRDFLRIRSSELLTGISPLTDEERWQQAVFARTVRNFWWTASSQPPGSALPAGQYVTARTPRFSEPVIVTDILSTFDFKSDDPTTSAMVSRYFLQLFKYGSNDASSGVDLFGLNMPVGQEMITKHEKNRSTKVTINVTQAPGQVFDAQPKYLPFVPRLLQPYDFIEAHWYSNPPLTNFATGTDIATDAWPLQLGFRGARVLPEGSPYRYIAQQPARLIKDYIAGNEPETFFLEITFPFASIPPLSVPLSVPLHVKTPQMGRPLLILGAASNLEGCQGGLYMEEDYYHATYLDAQKRDASSVALVGPVNVPLNLWAPDSDFRNTNMFNMWPVPHLHLPGAQLRLSISSGQVPVSASLSFQQQKHTRNSQDVRITFICRTV